MSPKPLNRLQIAWRAARDIGDGMLVNLGLGMPVFVADYLRPEVDVFIQSENGVIGVGALAPPDRADADLVDAGSRRITVRPGAAFVDSSASFAMIRGGHINVSILGAMEVDVEGNLANWTIPGKMVKGMGGAMDLVASARRVIVAMEHATKTGAPKIVDKCTLPLTGLRVVDTIITELAVIRVTPQGLVVEELTPGVTLENVQKLTQPKLILR